MSPADLTIVAACLVLGYAIGSLPLPALVGRLAGMDGSPGAGQVWRHAGPGWGLLAFAADLSRGVLPVALALVTFSWAAGVAAALGSVSASFWPAGGRLPADRSLVLVLGALLVLVPLVGLVAAAVVVIAAALRRRSSRA